MFVLCYPFLKMYWLSIPARSVKTFILIIQKLNQIAALYSSEHKHVCHAGQVNISLGWSTPEWSTSNMNDSTTV